MGIDLATGTADYATRAERYKPADPAAVMREIRRLALEGWTEFGIGQMLRLNPTAVGRAIGGRDE